MAIRAALLAVAVGSSFLVAHDGSAPWRVARLLLVVVLAGLAWSALRSPHRRTRSAVAIGVGLVTIPVGIAIAVPHAAKVGPSAMTVAGILVLAGGVVLLAAGTRWLLGSARRRWAVPAVAAVLVVLGGLTLTWGQAVAAANAPRPQLGSRTPADVGLDYRSVSFPATDGVRLSGWYVPSRNRAAVALLHGAGSTRSNVLDHAVVLAGNGYGVLLYDARGHGLSDGRAMDFGWYGDEDLGGAVAFLVRQPDVDATRIAAMGMSMGGEQAIGAAAAIPGIRAVVAEGATNRVAGDKEWLSDEYGWRGALSERLEALTYGFTDLLTSARPPITLREAARAMAPRRVLLVAAGDVPDEARAARYIAAGTDGTVTVWVAPATGHTKALMTHPEQWRARVLAFLAQELPVTAP